MAKITCGKCGFSFTFQKAFLSCPRCAAAYTGEELSKARQAIKQNNWRRTWGERWWFVGMAILALGIWAFEVSDRTVLGVAAMVFGGLTLLAPLLFRSAFEKRAKEHFPEDGGW